MLVGYEDTTSGFKICVSSRIHRVVESFGIRVSRRDSFERVKSLYLSSSHERYGDKNLTLLYELRAILYGNGVHRSFTRSHLAALSRLFFPAHREIHLSLSLSFFLLRFIFFLDCFLISLGHSRGCYSPKKRVKRAKKQIKPADE